MDPKLPCSAEASAHACHKRDVTQLEVAGAFAPFPGPLISKTVPSGQ
jgi:hypothetical protein